MSASGPDDLLAAGDLPWEDLREAGFLWLINRQVFHPRGFALAMQFDDNGVSTGWSILGDGSEPWRYEMDDEENACFRQAEASFQALRRLRGTLAKDDQAGDPPGH